MTLFAVLKHIQKRIIVLGKDRIKIFSLPVAFLMEVSFPDSIRTFIYFWIRWRGVLEGKRLVKHYILVKWSRWFIINDVKKSNVSFCNFQNLVRENEPWQDTLQEKTRTAVKKSTLTDVLTVEFHLTDCLLKAHLFSLEQSAVAQHAVETGHQIHFKATQVLSTNNFFPQDCTEKQ